MTSVATISWRAKHWLSAGEGPHPTDPGPVCNWKAERSHADSSGHQLGPFNARFMAASAACSFPMAAKTRALSHQSPG